MINALVKEHVQWQVGVMEILDVLLQNLLLLFFHTDRMVMVITITTAKLMKQPILLDQENALTCMIGNARVTELVAGTAPVGENLNVLLILLMLLAWKTTANGLKIIMVIANPVRIARVKEHVQVSNSVKEILDVVLL